MLRIIAGQERLPTREGAEIAGWRTAELPAEAPGPIRTHPHPTNVSFHFGDRLLLKVFREIEEGLHAQIEFGQFLNRSGRHAAVAKFLGAIEVSSRRGGPMALAVLHEYVQHESDAWDYTLDVLGDYFERVVTLEAALAPPQPPDWRSTDGNWGPPADLLEGYLDLARLLGRRTAELHLALAADEEDAAFAPEPFSPFYQRSVYQSMRGHALQTLDELQQQLPALAEDDRGAAERLLARRPRIVQEFRKVLAERLETTRIRCHGDYHLGQILFTGKDFVVIDFEGNADVPLSERRIKRSPLRDVASLARSIDYAARQALAQIATPSGPSVGSIRPSDLPRVIPWTRYWTGCVTATLISEYRATPGIDALLPRSQHGCQTLLELFLLERSLIDLGHELRARPDWVRIALDSVSELLGE
jgi:maltose alpha-D-glucosyltransferase/alpha-amylase